MIESRTHNEFSLEIGVNNECLSFEPFISLSKMWLRMLPRMQCFSSGYFSSQNGSMILQTIQNFQFPVLFQPNLETHSSERNRAIIFVNRCIITHMIEFAV